MHYLGRYELGQEAVIPLLAETAPGVAQLPDSNPRVAIYASDGTPVATYFMAAWDRYRATGLLAIRVYLGSAYATGRYLVSICYSIQGSPFLRACQFDVVAGGDPVGHVVSQYRLERPQASYLLQRTDGGHRYKRRNPYL